MTALSDQDLHFMRNLPDRIGVWTRAADRTSGDVRTEQRIARLRAAGLIAWVWDERASSAGFAVRDVTLTEAGLAALAAAWEAGR